MPPPTAPAAPSGPAPTPAAADAAGPVPRPASPAPAATGPATPPAPPAPLQGSVVDAGAGRHDVLRVLEWTVRGASKVLGDATVGFARLNGIVTIGGKLVATDVVARGTLNVLGTTEVTHRLAVHGTARFSASVRAVELAGAGRTVVEGDLRVNGPADLAGDTEISGSLIAESLRLQGTIATQGSLELRGDLHAVLSGGRSRTGPILGQRIEVVRPRFPPWRAPGSLRTLRLEGTELRLEGVVAEFVKGTAIYVGPGCRLARVEGPILERHRDAVIGPSAVTDDIPPDLWR